MYLSRLTLNPRSHRVRRDLGSPYEMHRTLLAAFPDKADGGTGRVLFHVEADHDKGLASVLVQSQVPPDWSRLRTATDYLTKEPEWKELDPRFQAGQQLLFRLRANPTVKRDGKRHAWLREEDQVAWLRRKACGEGKNSKPAGFRILSPRVVPEGVRFGRKTEGTRRYELSWFSVLFEGVLEVTDPEQLKVTLAEGIGSGKGFRFGLLSLARTMV